jgi:hypothetical protein
MALEARPVVKRFDGHDAFYLRYIDGKKWRVKDGFTYWLNKHEYVDVCSGCVTDFASIPRLLRVLWPSPGGLWDLAAVVHDKVYQDGYVRNVFGGTRIVQRAEADQMFRDGMELMGVRDNDKAALYNGVRVGGWWAWRKHRKAEHESLVS